MDQDLLGLAFGAGLVAALNPCGFAMLPPYLTLVMRGGNTNGVRALGRAVAATAAMATGFVAVFGLFGLLTVAAAAAVQRYLPYVTVLIGIGLVALGIWTLAGRRLTGLVPDSLAHSARWAPTARLGSMFGYGLGYAVASLSCTVGPFLAVTGASFRTGSTIAGLAVFGSYAAGFTLVVGVMAVAAALASTAMVDQMRRILPYVNRIGGVLLVVVGLYVAYYGGYELRLFTANGDPRDPVIALAGRLQGTLAGWVHRHGAWPWLGAMAVLLAGTLAWRVRARSAATHRPTDSAKADDGPWPPRPGSRRPGR